MTYSVSPFLMINWGVTAASDFAAAPTHDAMWHGWDRLRHEFRGIENRVPKFPGRDASAGAHVSFRHEVLDEVQPAIDRDFSAFMEAGALADPASRGGLELIDVVMRGRALGTVSGELVGELRDHYRRENVRSGRFSTDALFYRAGLRAFIDRKGQLRRWNHLNLICVEGQGGVEIHPINIPPDFASEMMVKRVKVGALAFGAASAATLALGLASAVWPHAPSVLWGLPAPLVMLAAYLDLHRGLDKPAVNTRA